MNASEVSALVFMTGRNCEPYVEASLGSLARQTHPAVHVLFVDDASVDGTAAKAQALLAHHFPNRHTFVRNVEQWGKARNAHVHLRAAIAAEDFVVVVDADDQLVEDTLLADMAQAYGQSFDVVWTNFRTDRNRRGANRALDPLRSPRGQGWATSHCFSFRAELLNNVDASYFKDDAGEWLRAACDLAIAYPVLDQTRRYCFMPRDAYQYTESNPASHHNTDANSVGLSSTLQQQNAAIVLRKPPLPCRRFVSDAPPVLDAVLGQKLAALDGRLAQVQKDVSKVQEQLAKAPYLQLALNTLHGREHVPLHWLRGVGGWALDVELLHHLCAMLDRFDKPRVLEFGSGRGSKVLARLCANRQGSLISVEHDPKWHQHTSLELERSGLGSVARVEHAPLQDVSFYGVAGRFYDMSWLDPQQQFDLVIVDGPPAATCSLARLPALPAVAAHLSPNGFDVVLDDYERAEEQKIVEVWRTVAPELACETLHFAKGVCVLSA